MPLAKNKVEIASIVIAGIALAVRVAMKALAAAASSPPRAANPIDAVAVYPVKLIFLNIFPMFIRN